MAVNTKKVKGRIRSVQNTKKITNAMQMIAAVKMRKAVEQAVNTREYANLAIKLASDLDEEGYIHPLMSINEESAGNLIIVITSNRGLCGNYNSAVVRAVLGEMKRQQRYSDLIAIGKKAASLAQMSDNINLLGLYTDLGDQPSTEKSAALVGDIVKMYQEGKYSKIEVFYTNYVSGMVREVTHQQILPVSVDVLKDMVRNLPGEDELANPLDQVQTDEYLFEPSKKVLLDKILPMLVEIQFYQSLLESAASEHSSRMLAMKSATDAAGDMIEYLKLEYNKARQAAITTEISEIVSGAAAL